MATGKLKVTLTGSYIGCTEPQRRTLRALGLRKRGDTRVHEDSPVLQGMILIVKHLISVEPVG
jgi:large subunit ribosomal protein L30